MASFFLPLTGCNPASSRSAASSFCACNKSSLASRALRFFRVMRCVPVPAFSCMACIFSIMAALVVSRSELEANHSRLGRDWISEECSIIFWALMASISAIRSMRATASAAKTSSMCGSRDVILATKCATTAGGTVLDRITPAVVGGAVVVFDALLLAARRAFSSASFITCFIKYLRPSPINVQLLPPLPALAVLPIRCTYVST
mmetsp:Transcript_7197/g.10841  ORF Transcript_7197/g.10841 Transcript_7197/m.10841 type:complete len:204 (+) Transcript_7197:759-1370(+)